MFPWPFSFVVCVCLLRRAGKVRRRGRKQQQPLERRRRDGGARARRDHSCGMRCCAGGGSNTTKHETSTRGKGGRRGGNTTAAVQRCVGRQTAMPGPLSHVNKYLDLATSGEQSCCISLWECQDQVQLTKKVMRHCVSGSIFQRLFLGQISEDTW